LQPKPAINGAALIDDSYNANPNSVKAGIDALCSVSGRHWLIFGEMREMGPGSAQMHTEIGEYARSKGIERLLAIGNDAKHTVTAFGNGAQWFASLDELIAAAKQDITVGITVLIKGSRGNRLERATNALAAEPAQHSGH
jgi:UDP-N-acetylmuramoyl-tripeptide--D-alanyl-D-alanine ligase